MSNRLAGKIALVTGASQGIGLAIARRLAESGAEVILTARNESKLSAAANSLAGGLAVGLACDLTQEAQIERLFAEIQTRYGRLDLLVNNAGAFEGGPLEALSTAAWDHVLAVNLRAPFLCTRAAFRMMKPQQGGRIINIGSISAQRVRPESAAYSASKHGLWGLTQVTALEGRAFNITCGCLHPGNVAVERRQTDLAEDAEPMMTADELAEVAQWMAELPPHVEMLEAIVLPHRQAYVGRG
ncbi:MAG TPA: SDR family oxidoreductase [Pirellulales bacterium]|jgi:NAD(P)-dependent dehydrogenase (short-subunit alcohol dehydrogenase family)|nr:SDR family oxidoreductase [Pirellulales bacterium]